MKLLLLFFFIAAVITTLKSIGSQDNQFERHSQSPGSDNGNNGMREKAHSPRISNQTVARQGADVLQG